MAIKYFCDGCGKEVTPAITIITGAIPEKITTMEMMNPATRKTIASMFCGECTTGLNKFVKELQKENKIFLLSEDLSFKSK